MSFYRQERDGPSVFGAPRLEPDGRGSGWLACLRDERNFPRVKQALESVLGPGRVESWEITSPARLIFPKDIYFHDFYFDDSSSDITPRWEKDLARNLPIALFSDQRVEPPSSGTKLEIMKLRNGGWGLYLPDFFSLDYFYLPGPVMDQRGVYFDGQELRTVGVAFEGEKFRVDKNSGFIAVVTSFGSDKNKKVQLVALDLSEEQDMVSPALARSGQGRVAGQAGDRNVKLPGAVSAQRPSELVRREAVQAGKLQATGERGELIELIRAGSIEAHKRILARIGGLPMSTLTVSPSTRELRRGLIGADVGVQVALEKDETIIFKIGNINPNKLKALTTNQRNLSGVLDCHDPKCTQQLWIAVTLEETKRVEGKGAEVKTVERARAKIQVYLVEPNPRTGNREIKSSVVASLETPEFLAALVCGLRQPPKDLMPAWRDERSRGDSGRLCGGDYYERGGERKEKGPPKVIEKGKKKRR